MPRPCFLFNHCPPFHSLFRSSKPSSMCSSLPRNQNNNVLLNKSAFNPFEFKTTFSQLDGFDIYGFTYSKSAIEFRASLAAMQTNPPRLKPTPIALFWCKIRHMRTDSVPKTGYFHRANAKRNVACHSLNGIPVIP